MKKMFLALALLMAAAVAAPAQTVVGNASLGVSSGTARVALPAVSGAPYVMVRQISSGGTSEVFYQLGSSAVNAATTNAALPPNGICLNVGPNTHLAAITASGSTGLRITRMTLCPPF